MHFGKGRAAIMKWLFDEDLKGENMEKFDTIVFYWPNGIKATEHYNATRSGLVLIANTMLRRAKKSEFMDVRDEGGKPIARIFVSGKIEWYQ